MVVQADHARHHGVGELDGHVDRARGVGSGRIALALALVALGCGRNDGEPLRGRGRTQLVYELDLDAAVADKAEAIRADIEAAFVERKILGVVRLSLAHPRELAVLVPDPARLAEVETLLRTDHAGVLQSADCPPGDPTGTICRRISASHVDAVRGAAIDTAITTLRRRLDVRKLREPAVLRRGDNLVVELDTEALADLAALTRPGKLEFVAVDDGSTFMQRLAFHVGTGDATDPAARSAGISTDVDHWSAQDTGVARNEPYLLARDRTAPMPAAQARRAGCPVPPGDSMGRCTQRGSDVIRDYLAALAQTDPAFALPAGHRIAYELATPTPSEPDQRPYWRTFYLERRARLTGAAIASATTAHEPDTQRPTVMLDFTRTGARQFGEVTAQLVGRKLAIVLDGTVVSAPIINGAIHGGRATISMGGSDPAVQEREANDLAITLETGALGVPLREIARIDTSAK